MTKKTKIILIVVGIIVIFVFGTVLLAYFSKNENLDSNTVNLLSGLSWPFSKDNKVGVGNIYISDYTDETGVKKHGPVVWLYFHNQNNNPEDQKILAHQGQVIKFGDQTVEVVKIDVGSFLMKASISMRVLISQEVLLADPNLLYASMWWAGMCSNKKNEAGGCYHELYLYSDGKFVKMSGFIKYNEESGREPDPSVQKRFSSSTVEQIKKTIRESGVMAKDCPPQEIMDVGWDYQINLDGVKKSFHNPPDDCKATFEFIDGVISGDLPKE
jgi:hypothetical protein